MNNFSLNEHLGRGCYTLGELDCCLVLLMRNALFPWFVLVPRVEEIELYQVDAATQRVILREINVISRFVHTKFDVEKLNIGAIGNIVPQLHVHIVGRREDDYAWPGVVWGCKNTKNYGSGEIARITQMLQEELGDQFTPAG